MLTFASQRRLPSCISQSETPISRSIRRSSSRYAFASSGLLISGLLTISRSGVPVRLRSTLESPPLPLSSCMFLPASSSRCARMMPMRFGLYSFFGSAAALISSQPSELNGRSYWLI